jgi:adenylate cyclase
VDLIVRREAARRAGIDVVELDRMVELRMIVPDEGDRFTAGDVRKAGLLSSLQSGGLPLDAVAAEIDNGSLSIDFLDNPAFDHFSALSSVTFEELGARTGVPVELLIVIREAIGSAVPRPTDLVREIELGIVPLIEGQLASGYPPDTVERSLRTMGESVRRFTLAAADDFRTHVIEPAAREPNADIAGAAVSAMERMSAATDQAILAVYHAQQAHAWTANILDDFERSLSKAGVVDRIGRPPAMCFLDLTGYTRFTAERGDKAAAELAETLRRLVQRTSVEHGGRPVKWLGDGVMFHFRDPGPAVVAALEMIDGIATAGLPPAHVGLHAGPVLFQDGDYYGQTVNVASRIADYARPGEVLVSQEVVDAAGDVAVSFAPVGPVELKGVGGALALHIAHRT